MTTRIDVIHPNKASDLTAINAAIDSGPLLGYLTKETKAGDEGVNCSGELHVGLPGNGQESVFGEGDSHTTGMTVLTTSDLVAFTDVTEKAKELDGDTFDIFNGTTTTNSAFYVGSDMSINGIKMKTSTLVDPTGGNVVREFWDGVGWESFFTLVTKSDAPYTQRADDIGTVAESEQIRFSGHTSQAKTTVNGENKYWIRFRVSSPITATGTVDQVKLHTNRYEINADGFTEYFGDGQYSKDLLIHWHLMEHLNNLSPANEDISFANGLVLNMVDNEFANGVTDGIGSFIIIPEGMDTGRGISLEVLWTPLNNNAGDVVYEVVTYQTRVGDTLTTANVPETFSGTETILVNSDNLLRQTTINVETNTLLPGEILAFGLKRLGGAGADTYIGNVGLVNVRATAYFWKP